jgi:hypothetical protein
MKRHFLCKDQSLPPWLQEHRHLLINCFEWITQPEGSFLSLRDGSLVWNDQNLGPFFVEHFQENKAPRILKGRKELLAKAMGLKSQGQLIVDSTVGAGKDARFFLELGCKVVGFEKDPLIFLLLQSAIFHSKWAQSDQIKIIHIDAVEALKTYQWAEDFSVYIDPMFEGQKSAAKPKKTMQIFRELGLHAEWQEIADAALSSQAQRVVLKQPVRTQAHKYRVFASFQGKSVCYQTLKV